MNLITFDFITGAIRADLSYSYLIKNFLVLIIQNISYQFVADTQPVQEILSLKSGVIYLSANFGFYCFYGAIQREFSQIVPDNKNIYSAVQILDEYAGHNHNLQFADAGQSSQYVTVPYELRIDEKALKLREIREGAIQNPTSGFFLHNFRFFANFFFYILKKNPFLNQSDFIQFRNFAPDFPDFRLCL